LRLHARAAKVVVKEPATFPAARARKRRERTTCAI
jgi:hypothetical protein